MTSTLDSLRLSPTATRAQRRSAGLAHSTATRLGVIGAALVVVVGLAGASLFIGSGDIAPDAVWQALLHGGTDTNAVLVTQFRVPRTLLGVVVGISLGLAGALIQAVTRNPLADPGILGVNQGAYFTVVLSITIAGVADITNYVWWSFLGAGLAAIVVYLIGSRGRSGATPVRLVLAGVALSAVLQGITFTITLLNPDIFDKIRFWQAGSLQGRQIEIFWGVLPFAVTGMIIALLLARSLNAIALGDDLATSLGARIVRTRLIAVVAITLLCGSATAATGPIGFLGLMVPFLARSFVGPDQRWVLPLSAVFAPIVFLSADIVGRVVIEGEMPVGVVAAFVGAPVLILLVRRAKVSGL
ncbi:iron chelate uptake ABC transporter family permease subunit [Microbacteriaceae bacterium VKM Ac-2855]|nr:iron chelate uptake ABC transporter family permease subunit [Microbacteriaceae bacterium VKM Ac-2855]